MLSQTSLHISKWTLFKEKYKEPKCCSISPSPFVISKDTRPLLLPVQKNKSRIDKHLHVKNSTHQEQDWQKITSVPTMQKEEGSLQRDSQPFLLNVKKSLISHPREQNVASVPTK